MIFISCKFALLPFQTTYSRFLFYLPLLKNFPFPRSFFFLIIFVVYIFSSSYQEYHFRKLKWFYLLVE